MKKYDKCLKEVRKKLKKGKIKKTYKCGRKICRTDEFAICKDSMNARDFNKKHWGEPRWE